MSVFPSKRHHLPPVIEKHKGVQEKGCGMEHADSENWTSVYNKMGVQQFQHRQSFAEGFANVSTALLICN